MTKERGNVSVRKIKTRKPYDKYILVTMKRSKKVNDTNRQMKGTQKKKICVPE